MGVYTLLSAVIVYVTLREPQRGGKEEDLAEVLSRGVDAYHTSHAHPAE